MCVERRLSGDIEIAWQLDGKRGHINTLPLPSYMYTGPPPISGRSACARGPATPPRGGPLLLTPRWRRGEPRAGRGYHRVKAGPFEMTCRGNGDKETFLLVMLMEEYYMIVC
jgi:hypothetical protein